MSSDTDSVSSVSSSTDTSTSGTSDTTTWENNQDDGSSSSSTDSSSWDISVAIFESQLESGGDIFSGTSSTDNASEISSIESIADSLSSTASTSDIINAYNETIEALNNIDLTGLNTDQSEELLDSLKTIENDIESSINASDMTETEKDDLISDLTGSGSTLYSAYFQLAEQSVRAYAMRACATWFMNTLSDLRSNLDDD